MDLIFTGVDQKANEGFEIFYWVTWEIENLYNNSLEWRG